MTRTPVSVYATKRKMVVTSEGSKGMLVATRGEVSGMRVMRVDSIAGESQVKVGLLRAAAKVACQHYRAPLASDPLASDDDHHAWERFGAGAGVECRGRLSPDVARSWSLSPGRCAVYVAPCGAGLSGVRPRRRGRR